MINILTVTEIEIEDVVGDRKFFNRRKTRITVSLATGNDQDKDEDQVGLQRIAASRKGFEQDAKK